MRRKRSRVGAIACLAVLALAGCAREASTFEDVSALAKEVSAEGVTCDGVVPGRGTELVSEIGSCRGSDVTLYVFESAEAFDDWKKVAPLAAPAAVGVNWAATGDLSAVERIAEGLDGEMAGSQ